MLRKNEVQSVIRQTIMEHRHLGPLDALTKCADAVNAAVAQLLEPGQTTSGYTVGEVHPRFDIVLRTTDNILAETETA